MKLGLAPYAFADIYVGTTEKMVNDAVGGYN